MPSLPQLSGSTRRSVILLDSHPIARHGLSALIRKQAEFLVAGEAESPAEALQAVQEREPDILLMDLYAGQSCGLELIKTLHALRPQLKILVLSALDESIYAERAVRAGARGFISKMASTEAIMTALQRVSRGEVALSDAVAAQMLQRLALGSEVSPEPQEALSDRELEVFEYLGQGYGTREIAVRMGLSVKTVETYRAKIKDKLHLSNATRLVASAVEWRSARTGSGSLAAVSGIPLTAAHH